MGKESHYNYLRLRELIVLRDKLQSQEIGRPRVRSCPPGHEIGFGLCESD